MARLQNEKLENMAWGLKGICCGLAMVTYALLHGSWL